jgi:hypothetical protein
MMQYTFDESKIRKNAKRASSASFFARNAKWMPLTAAAAVIVMFFGGYMLLGLFADGGIIDPPLPNYNIVSDEDRMNDIIYREEMILANGFSSEKKEMYISFAEPMTLEELDSVLNLIAPEDGAVMAVALWNGEFVDVAATTESADNRLFSGARIIAYDDLYFELRDRPEFTAVEFQGGLINNDNFRPIALPHNNNNSAIPLPNIEEPVTPDPADLNDPILDPPFEPANPNNPNNPDNPSDPTEPNNPDNPSDPAEPNDPNNPPDPAEPNDPDNPNEPNEPTEPVEEDFIELNIDSALGVHFINENKFVLLTRSQVLLYEIVKNADGRHSFKAVEGFVAVNPRITYTDAKTGTLLIIGGDAFGRLTNLYMADGESGVLRQLETSDILQEHGQISYALFRNNEIVMKTQTPNISAIYTANRNSGYSFSNLIKSEDNLIVLSLTNSGFIYAQVSENGELRTYEYNARFFNIEEIDMGLASLGRDFSFRRSPDAGNFAVISDGIAYIWNAELATLTDYGIEAGYIRFHRNSGSMFNDGDNNWYILRGMQILPSTESEAERIQRPEFSEAFRLLEITPAVVRIEILT